MLHIFQVLVHYLIQVLSSPQLKHCHSEVLDPVEWEPITESTRSIRSSTGSRAWRRTSTPSERSWPRKNFHYFLLPYHILRKTFFQFSIPALFGQQTVLPDDAVEEAPRTVDEVPAIRADVRYRSCHSTDRELYCEGKYKRIFIVVGKNYICGCHMLN